MDSLALLEGLLQQYSPTGEEAGAVEYLVDSMTTLGFAAHVDGAGNAVGTIGDGPREILLLGHIDTVPGFIQVQREEGRLYGRGAVDAKGPLAGFVAAATQVGPQAGWRITVVGAVGEEGNSRGAKYLCDVYNPPNLVVVGEPSGWEHVTLGYKGSLWLDYTVSLPLAHTAARSASASERAVDFWNGLVSAADGLNAERERVFDQLTPSLREMISSLDGFNDTARLKINIRIPPGIEYPQLQALLQSLAGEGQLRLDEFTPAYRAEKNTPLVRAFLAGIRKAGGRPGFVLKSGTADMNLAGPAWGCPILAYGAGDSNLDHTPQEHILIQEYLKGVDVLADALAQLTRATAQAA